MVQRHSEADARKSSMDGDHSTSAISGEPSWKERMAIALARDIVDGERIISGAHTEISFAAALLAQKMHAPNIKLQLGGTCFLVNVADLPVRLPKTSTEYRMVRWAEIAYDHMETFMYFGAPGGSAYYTGTRPATNKYFVGDKFFAGGLQVDGEGNTNLIGLNGDGQRRFGFRGPGSIGIPDIVTVATPYIFVTHHDRRTLVPKVDYISMLGPNGWRANKYPGHGPKWIITPRAIFTFDRNGRAQLSATFSGTSVKWVQENTGFSFALDPDLSEMPEPTAEELHVLRSEIDPDAVLRR
jgi:glutaconate CoA-transferase subunit B